MSSNGSPQGTIDYGSTQIRVAAARKTQAGRAFMGLWSGWYAMFNQLSTRALIDLEGNRFPDPCRPGTWITPATCVDANLRRHGIDRIRGTQLAEDVGRRFLEEQSEADRAAGLHWNQLYTEAQLKKLNRDACRTLSLDFDDPETFKEMADKRGAVGRKLGLDEFLSDQISRQVVSDPDSFDPEHILSWRIGTQQWVRLARELGYQAPERVERPVGVFVAPAQNHSIGWQLSPTLSMEMILLVEELGGEVDRDLCGAKIPHSQAATFVSRVDQRYLTHARAHRTSSKSELRNLVAGEVGVPVPGVGAGTALERWGQLQLHHNHGRDENQARYDDLSIKVRTFTVRGFNRQQLGCMRRDAYSFRQKYSGGYSSHNATTDHGHSSPMDLGEALSVARDHGLPLLLSSEAGASMAGKTRLARMRGKPGMLTITRGGDGISVQVETVSTPQVPGALRELKANGEKVTLDAGARQTINMARAKALSDDPILLGRQAEVAALKVVGSGVDASDTACGKTVTTARALMHRAAATERMRALVVAPDRQMRQWATELAEGNVGRELPPLVPNAMVCTVSDGDGVPIAAQIRRADRAAGERPLVIVAGRGLLKSVPVDLTAIRWHLLVVDEAHHYSNPSGQLHKGLRVVRPSALDCWMLSATPIGRTAEHLDVLVGLALGDEGMITERMAIRGAGDLTDEVNAHRVRTAYGPYLVRVTHEDMAAYKPATPPAAAMAIEPDAALNELLEEIRRGGQAAYERLLALFKELKSLEGGSDKAKEALIELSRVQGTVLGNVGVYVAASVDPATLLHSKAAMAVGLRKTDLVERAVSGFANEIPTLRGMVAEAIASTVRQGEQVLVFSERVVAARMMAQTLANHHGVKVGVLDGSVSTQDGNALMAAFTAGEIQVLCVTRIAQEGHNLQSASTVVHLDMPWVPRDLEQRVGRAARIGNKAKEVHSMIPYIKGGGIEHVIGVLAPRAAEQHQLLDGFEGMSAEKATLSSQLMEITEKVARSKADDGFGEDSARLQVAASVFGSGRS